MDGKLIKKYLLAHYDVRRDRGKGMKTKPMKFSACIAASFPSAVDVVVYKDEQARLYRLRYVDESSIVITQSKKLHKPEEEP